MHVVAAVYFTVLTVFMQLKSPRFIKNNKNVLKIKRLFLFNFQKEKENKIAIHVQPEVRTHTAHALILVSS